MTTSSQGTKSTKIQKSTEISKGDTTFQNIGTLPPRSVLTSMGLSDKAIARLGEISPKEGEVPDKITAEDMGSGRVSVRMEYTTETHKISAHVNGVNVGISDFVKKGDACRELVVVFALIMEKSGLENENYLKAAEAKKILDLYGTGEKFEDYFIRKDELDL